MDSHDRDGKRRRKQSMDHHRREQIDGSKAEEYSGRINDLWERYRQLDEEDGARPTIQYEIGSFYAELGNNVRALHAYRQSRNEASAQGDRTAECTALHAIAMVAARMENYTEALRSLVACLRIQSSMQDTAATATTWMKIGVISGQAGNVDKALRSLERAIDIARSNGHYQVEVRALMHVAMARAARGELETALEQLLRALVSFEALDDKRNIAEALSAIGNVQEAMGEIDAALDYQERAMELVGHHPGPDFKAVVLLRMAGLHTTKGDLDRALVLLDEATAIAAKSGRIELQAQVCEALARTRELRREYEIALQHYKHCMMLREKQRKHNSDRLLAELQVLFSVELAEREREIYRLEAEKLRQEVNEKRKELTEMALSLVQKSEFLDDVKRQLKDIMESSKEQHVARSLIEEVESIKDTTEGWRMFEHQFDEVHRDFMQRLAERYPTLTPMELKLCALTRIDLATKDIAQLLFLSVRSIQNHRYRIRKKLDLTSDENLTTFLMGI